MHKIIRLLLPVLILISIKGLAQDRHFTHFRMAPLTLNPALTGAFHGTYRISGVYRGQWTSVTNFGGGYLTPHVSLDVPILGGLLMENDWVGVGISILGDNAGQSNYSTRLAGTSATYHMGFDEDYNQVLSIGFQYGLENRTFDTRNLRTPSVLFGQEPERLIVDNDGTVRDVSSGALSIGFTYKSVLNDQGDLWRGGLAVKGINSNKGSFVRTDSIIGMENQPNFTKPTIIGFAEVSTLLTDKIRLNPAVIFQVNGPFSTVMAQTTADYLLNPAKRMILTGGLGYRIGDSVHLIGGIQIKDLKVTLAYDITVSGFSDATRNGAFEIGVGYIGKIYRKPQVDPVIFCPRL